MLFREIVNTNKLMKIMLFSLPFLEKRIIKQNRKPCNALINKNKLKIDLGEKFIARNL